MSGVPFTGAVSARTGAFEAAAGGTVFLDEIGELPSELQPKLLRVLEQRAVQRLGSSARRPVDVRVIAATHRDLRREVNEGRFRPDLYYRLAVVRIRLPSLRERPEDIPLLVEAILGSLGADRALEEELMHGEAGARMQSAAWPGNVRELRNYIERSIVLRAPQPLTSPSGDRPGPFDERMSFANAKQQVIEDFERRYLHRLLERCGGNVSQAAREAEINRPHLHRLLRRYGLRG